jgi:hypothetical protein
VQIGPEPVNRSAALELGPGTQREYGISDSCEHIIRIDGQLLELFPSRFFTRRKSKDQVEQTSLSLYESIALGGRRICDQHGRLLHFLPTKRDQ